MRREPSDEIERGRSSLKREAARAPRFRRARRVLVGLSFALVLGWAAYLVLLPAYASAKVSETLGGYGFADASFELNGVSLKQLSLERLKLDRTRVGGAAKVVINYDLRSLLRGRVKTIEVFDAQWRLDIDGDGVKTGLPASDSPFDVSGLPFDSVRFERLELLVGVDGKSHRAIVDASIVSQPDGGFRFELTGSRDHLRAHASGALGSPVPGDVVLGFHAEILEEDTASGSGNRAVSDASYDSRSGALSVSANIRWDALSFEVAGEPVELRDVRTEGAVSLVGGTISSVTASATIDAAAIGAERAHSLVVGLTDDAESVRVSASASGSRWSVETLTTTLSRDASRWPPTNMPVAWKLRGEPPSVVDRLRDAGLDIELAGPVVSSGSGVVTFDSERNWQLDIEASRLGVTMKRLGVSGAIAAGISADLRISGQLSAERLDLGIEPGSTLKVSRVTGSRGLGSSPRRATPALSVTARAPSRFSMPIKSSGDWQIDLPSLEARLEGIRYSSGATEIRGLTGTLGLRLAAAADQLVLHSLLPTTFSVDSIRVTSGDVLTGCRPRLLPRERPLLRIRRQNKNRPVIDVSARLRCQARSTIGGRIRARLSTLDADVFAHRTSGGTWSLRLPIRGDIDELRVAEKNVVISNTRFDLPLQWGISKPPASGRIDVGRLAIGKRDLGSGVFNVAQGRSRTFTLDGNALLFDANLAVTAEVALAATPSARFDLTLASTKLAGNRKLQALVKEAIGARLGGQLEGDASISFGESGVVSRALFKVSDAELSWSDGDKRVSGISGSVQFDDLFGLVSHSNQALRWKAARAGRFEFGNGFVRFNIDGPRRLALNRAVVSTGNGLLSASPFSFDPTSGGVEFDLSLRAVRVRKWLPLITNGRASGTGILDGKIPIRLRRGQSSRLALGTGVIKARRRGCFKITDKALLETLVADEAAAQGYSQMIRDRLVRSLSDFCYRDLRFDIEPSKAGSNLRIRTVGKGRLVKQEVSLEVNLRGFDELLDPALLLLRD